MSLHSKAIKLVTDVTLKDFRPNTLISELGNKQLGNGSAMFMCFMSNQKIFKQAYLCDSCNTFSLADRDCQVVVGFAAWANVRYTELF